MELRQLVVVVPAPLVDIIAAHLVDAGAPGVEVRDDTTMLATEKGSSAIIACMPSGDVLRIAGDVQRYIAALREVGAQVDPWSCRDEPLPPDDWVARYKAFFKVTRVGRRMVVRPAWEDYQPEADDIVITMDPGQAFGTGVHPSTRLCLRAIERIDRLWGPQRQVLDLGCGSGILSIAAAQLWPSAKLQAIDVDPVALEVARKMGKANDVGTRIKWREGSIEGAEGAFDLILANLQADLLIRLKKQLIEKLSPSGRLVLSGMLCEQVGEVVGEFVADLTTEAEFSEDEEGWRMAVLRRYPFSA